MTFEAAASADHKNGASKNCSVGTTCKNAQIISMIHVVGSQQDERWNDPDIYASDVNACGYRG